MLRSLWGFALVAVGVIGLILPIMPGWVFLIPGLAILSQRYAWARSLLDWAKKKSRVTRFQ